MLQKRRRLPLPSGSAKNQTMVPGYAIRLSQRAEAALLPEVEREALKRLSEYPAEYPFEVAPSASSTRSAPALLAAHEDGRLWVAVQNEANEARPVGVALMIDLGLFAHLEALAVLPAHGRQGLGAELLEAACGWALTRGFSAVTLCAFREVPWSAPFLAGRGFETISQADLPRELLRVQERERTEGWRTELRAFMQREL